MGIYTHCQGMQCWAILNTWEGAPPHHSPPPPTMRAFAAYLAFTTAAIGLTGYALQGVAAGLELRATERTELIRSIR